tara:strand:+ start:1068 stop:2213 length:1146 start_codon:yes stop_codon:yes gene_type:complete
MKSLPEDKKKAPKKHKGNSLDQTFDNEKFVEEFNEWRDNCLSISAGDMKVQRVPSLYAFLKQHIKNARAKSRNKDVEGQGVADILTAVEGFVDNELLTVGNIKTIKALASTLKGMKDTGQDIGGKSPAFDPAFILFTDKPVGEGGQKRKERKVQGHYATESYAKKNKVPKADDEWFAGKNPPHQALFSESSTKFARPRGLLYILEDIDKPEIDDLEIENFSGVDAEDLEDLSSIQSYFNKVTRNNAFWNAGGKLLTNKLRTDFKNQKFRLTNKDQNIARGLAKLGPADEDKSIAGDIAIVSFPKAVGKEVFIELVDRALKRKGTNKAPNGFRAWQNDTKSGFDYRKTAKEKYPDTYQDDDFKLNPEQKVISKMWQQILWRH